MTRRAFVIKLSGGSTYDDLRLSVIEFEKHWDRFVRRLFGCRPDGEISPDTCKPAEGSIDYAAFSAVRKVARKLFDL